MPSGLNEGFFRTSKLCLKTAVNNPETDKLISCNSLPLRHCTLVHMGHWALAFCFELCALGVVSVGRPISSP